jgi:hypothetical protein
MKTNVVYYQLIEHAELFFFWKCVFVFSLRCWVKLLGVYPWQRKHCGLVILSADRWRSVECLFITTLEGATGCCGWECRMEYSYVA